MGGNCFSPFYLQSNKKSRRGTRHVPAERRCQFSLAGVSPPLPRPRRPPRRLRRRERFPSLARSSPADTAALPAMGILEPKRTGRGAPDWGANTGLASWFCFFSPRSSPPRRPRPPRWDRREDAFSRLRSFSPASPDGALGSRRFSLLPFPSLDSLRSAVSRRTEGLLRN